MSSTTASYSASAEPASSQSRPRRHSRSAVAFPAWRWVAALAIFGDIALNYWWNTHPANGQTMGMVSARYPTLLTPAGWAFGIWGLIFLSLAVYAVWQLLPAQRRHTLPDAVARPLSLACLSTGLWVVAFSYEQIYLCLLLMLTALGSLIMVYGRARQLIESKRLVVPWSWPFSLFMGWISLATVITLTLALREAGWETPGSVTVMLSLVLMAAVVTLGLVIGRHFHDAVYPLVLVWGLVGIWAARNSDVPELGWLALAGALVLLVNSLRLILTRARRRR